jgi:hypothetical protein
MLAAFFVMVSAPLALIVALIQAFSSKTTSDGLLFACIAVGICGLLLNLFCLPRSAWSTAFDVICAAVILFSVFGCWRIARREKMRP